MTGEALEELRSGLLNAATAYHLDAGIPEGAERWSDSVTDAAVEAVLPDVAAMLVEAVEDAHLRHRAS